MTENEGAARQDTPHVMDEHAELKEARDAGDFERAFRYSQEKSLEVPSQYWVELSELALQKGKYVFARTALSQVPDKLRQQSQLHLAEAARLYEQRNYDVAARQVGCASVFFPDHSYPIPFQYTAWQLHEHCNPQVDARCVFEQPTLETVRVALAYLAGSTKIIAEFEQQISARANLAFLVFPLAAFWDKRQHDYLERFRDVASKLLSASPPNFEEFQINLLGRTLPDEFAEIYFREITSFHPLMALLLCKKAVGRRIFLRPQLLDGTTILNFYENPKPLSEAAAPKKPAKR